MSFHLRSTWLLLVFILTSSFTFHIQGKPPEGQDEQEPKVLHALVVFTAEPSALTLERVQPALESAFGYPFPAEDAPEDATRFVAGEDLTFIVIDDGEALLINSFPAPYWDNPGVVADQIDDPAVAGAIRKHRGWFSVDLLGAEELNRSDIERRYREMGRVLAALADEHALAAYVTATGSVAVFDDDLKQAIRTGDPADAIGEPLFSEIVGVQAEDPRMIEAMEEARRRWGEIVKAFENRGPDNAFLVKVRFSEGEDTEHMWVVPEQLTMSGGHGELTNEPRELSQLKMGDRVTFKRSEVSDWGYAIGPGEGRTVHGMFTDKVLDLISAEADR